MNVQDVPDYSYSERVIVLAPTARDGEVTAMLLAGVSIDSVMGQGARHVEALMRAGAGALVVPDTTLADPAFKGILRALAGQPSWSDLPVIAVCRRGHQASVLREAELRSLTVLERPMSTRVMVSAVKTALRGRRWQYQIRDQMDSLQQADSSLRLADQRKDEFLATLAHELRNPLAPIRTGLQLLTRVADDPVKLQSVTDMMQRQTIHMVRLIDDLLEVSRIATGKIILQRERLDLRRVVETALESCAPLVARGGHRLDVVLPDDKMYVDGDFTRLSQSLSNLVNNAAKYTPDGGCISVALGRAGEAAVLTVTDNGIGLPRDMLTRVFDMFAQVNRSLERAQGGLGIGLALVRSLVSLHGGTVSAQSSGPGKGSTFTITLPLIQALTQTAVTDQAAQVVVTPRRVLVVDDNQDAAESMAMLLGIHGHEVRVEYGGQAALNAAVNFVPEAVFCDLGMPGMDGYEFATRLRQDRRFTKTLLVALSGWGAEEDKRRSRAAGFDAHLTKPASVDAAAALLVQL
jgi:signal transduction histidine kinase